MLSLTTIGLFTLACIGLVLTPGPNMIYLVSRTVTQGRRSGVISLAGVTAGLAVHALAAAFGLSALLFAVPFAFEVVKIIGAGYLLWLAWNSVKPGAVSPFAVRSLPPDPPARLLRVGLATSLINPKVAMFYLSLFPQFVDPAAGSVLVQSLSLAAIQLITSIIGDLAFVLMAAEIARFLGARPFWIAFQRWLMAAVFAGLAIRLAVQSRA